jgi:hypothetical protein
MTRILRVAIAVVLGGLFGAVATWSWYGHASSVRMDFDHDNSANTTGIYPAEHDPQWTLTFAWTAADAEFPGLSTCASAAGGRRLTPTRISRSWPTDCR